MRDTIPGNTQAADKTNFWRYSAALLGTPLPAGHCLAVTQHSELHVTGFVTGGYAHY